MITIPAHPKIKNQSKVSFSTATYVSAYNTEPGGRGCWVFCPVDKYKLHNYLDYCVTITGNKTITEAKQAAAGYFAKMGVWNVIICP